VKLSALEPRYTQLQNERVNEQLARGWWISRRAARAVSDSPSTPKSRPARLSLTS